LEFVGPGPTDRQRLVLVVEDEPAIARAVEARLEAEGFAVASVADGPGAVAAAVEVRPDLIVLDLNLPGFDGLEVCRQVHASPALTDRARVPVVMLTARGEETDLLVGLGVGADDYLTKPFSMKELVARIRAVLRRADEAPPPGDGASPDPSPPATLAIDGDRRMVSFHGKPVHLTPTEFDLLWVLHQADGTVLTRLQLLDRVWGYRDGSGTRTVDSHIRSIRRKLADGVIRTVHGVGYSLSLDLEPDR
jgi:DNA-binding response OmpR family regulator